MNICVFGTGAIGSVFAYQLARAGHRVTAVARGKRYEQLVAGQAILLDTGERAEVQPAGALDVHEPYDLLLVTLFAPQVEPLLPTLGTSRAKRVMLAFNTFERMDRFREVIGPERFELGFPGGIFSKIVDGKLNRSIRSGTTVGNAKWAKVFTDAGIPTVVEADMQSWLRCHAALVAPLMAAGTVVAKRRGGLTWGESRQYAAALREGLAVVRGLGHALLPKMMATLVSLPLPVVTLAVWAMNKTEMQKQLGRMGEAEPRMLIDQIAAAAPGRAPTLLAIRP